MAELRVSGLGASVSLQASGAVSEALLPQLTRCWSWCLEESPDSIDAGVVPIPDDGDDEDSVLQRLTQSVTQALIRARAGDLFLFHAAALCHPVTGATLLAIAPGNTGKTTLAARLGKRYGYLTDETAGVLDDGRLLPYPKPLSVRRDGLPKHETSPDDLGLVRPTAEARLAAVVLLDRDKSSKPALDVVELPMLDAIAEMAPETSSLAAMPRALHRLRDLLEPVEPVLRVTYGEAALLTRLVEDLVGRP